MHALFERYADPAGWDGERLVDVEAFYGRLRRSVQPQPTLAKEKTGLELHARALENELAGHPGGLHPYGQYPRREALSMK